ncbi:hypothetical protein ACHAXT_006748 [Thalassiosira profunda]
MFGRRLSLPYRLPDSAPTFAHGLHADLITSTELIFRSRLTWLLIFGPVALVGKTGIFGESTCFVLAGLALIPLAERLSFVTEEVANHTNQTIGALLNATFGNAPELLISSAALQEGFYRVVQLTLLGSMLTNLLFELRIVTGNASIGMLMLAVAGMALPAALMLSDEMISHEGEREYVDKNGDGKSDINDGPTFSMVGFSRFNAVIMIVGYLLYLLFQLGSHSEEFEDLEEEEAEGESVHMNGTNHADEEEGHVRMPRATAPKRKKRARKNKFCHRVMWGNRGLENEDEHDERGVYGQLAREGSIREMELSPRIVELEPVLESQSLHNDLPQCRPDTRSSKNDSGEASNTSSSRRRVGLKADEDAAELAAREQIKSRGGISLPPQPPNGRSTAGKSHCSDEPEDEEPYILSPDLLSNHRNDEEEVHMSFKAGLFWLFIITISISAMSDILVDTIDGFAYRYGISEVFTSLIILPYFSNIAEQVSALIFAYRNEMDLCIGITVGSAVQIALFVLPGSVLIGWAMDRSMSLFFRGFETCCLIFSVVSVAAVLQGGTTNWLVGCYLLGVYAMIAAGFWYHELENLSVDGELLNLHNHTGS